MYSEKILKKWGNLIEFAKKYWIESQPTGISDSDFDALEKKALEEDNFSVRDYVLTTFAMGTRYPNKYIEKLKKYKISDTDTMLNAIKFSAKELGIGHDDLYCVPKYDGSSIAIYLDPSTGKPHKLVTCGNQNLSSSGIDQTWKLIDLIPEQFEKGLVAIQCEALIDTKLLKDKGISPEIARQKANGLINSKYCMDEVKELLTLRAYRYYVDVNSYEGQNILKRNYREVLSNFSTKIENNHITFAPAFVKTLREIENLENPITESTTVSTGTGDFLADGWVLYNEEGVCQRALKFAGAGSGTESIKTTVKSIQWNDQTDKGKDSWSANVIVDPVVINGCTIKKPSAGSVAKLMKNNITPGAEVGIILANSTIPMVGEVFKPGNGDYMWPTCKCGYTLGPSDIYGSLVKCGNPMCSERLERMRKVLSKGEINLNKLLVIDRFDWLSTGVSVNIIKDLVKDNKKQEYHDYLAGFLHTKLQLRNLDLVWEASWKILREKISSDQ